MSAEQSMVDTLGRLRRRPFYARTDDAEIRSARYFEMPKGRAPVSKHDGAQQ